MNQDLKAKRDELLKENTKDNNMNLDYVHGVLDLYNSIAKDECVDPKELRDYRPDRSGMMTNIKE